MKQINRVLKDRCVHLCILFVFSLTLYPTFGDTKCTSSNSNLIIYLQPLTAVMPGYVRIAIPDKIVATIDVFGVIPKDEGEVFYLKTIPNRILLSNPVDTDTFKIHIGYLKKFPIAIQERVIRIHEKSLFKFSLI